VDFRWTKGQSILYRAPGSRLFLSPACTPSECWNEAQRRENPDRGIRDFGERVPGVEQARVKRRRPAQLISNKYKESEMHHTERDRLFEILYNKSFIYRDNPPFTLVSGRQSPYYFDCKAATLDPEGLSLVGCIMFQAIRNLRPDAVGGLTLGADPISLSTSLEAHRQGVSIRPIIVRKEPKKHGTARWIEGLLDGVKRVVAIDDVITTGGSTITAIERMREAGLDIIAAAVMVDREEGGREAIEATGVSVIPLFSRSDFDRRRLG
jgi:orotate phosphoribosyltransferase